MRSTDRTVLTISLILILSVGFLGLFPSSVYAYGTPSGDDTYEWIDRFRTDDGDVDNSSDQDGGYADYTNLTATATAGGTMGITVTVEATDAYQEHVSVWVDWDQSDTFEEGERVYLGSCTPPSGGGTCELSYEFDVGQDTPTGTTRLRTMACYDGDCGEPTNPNNSSFFGEAEDYTVDVQLPDPEVAFTSPSDGSDTNVTPITVQGNVNFVVPAGDSVSLTANGTSEGNTSIQSDQTWSLSGIDLSSGSNELVARLHDGSTADPIVHSDTITVNKVNTAVITIKDPNDGSATDQSSIDVSGGVDGPSETGDSIVVSVNGTDEPAVALQSDSSWLVSGAGLSDGDNEIVASYYDGSTSDTLVNQDTITVTKENYPAPSGDDQYEWINRVEAVRGPSSLRIDNTSGQDGGYADYTNLSATVIRGGTMQVSVQADAGDNYTEHVSLWVDWDRDISFETSERVYFGSCTATCTLTEDVKIPSDAELTSTRMRIIQKYNDEPTDPNETGFFGEGEDYALAIEELDPPAQVDATQALANGSDTAEITVSVPKIGGTLEGHPVSISAPADVTLSSGSDTTNASGQASFTATSLNTGEYTVNATVKGKPLSDTATVSFVSNTQVEFSIGGVNTVAEADITGSDTKFIKDPTVSADGTQAAFWANLGAFSSSCFPACPQIYVSPRDGSSEPSRITGEAFQADHLNQLTWSDINGDGTKDILFTNVDHSQLQDTTAGHPYYYERAQPFRIPVDGSASDISDTQLPNYSLSPGDTTTQFHYLDYHPDTDQIVISEKGNLYVYKGSDAVNNTPSEFKSCCRTSYENNALITIQESNSDPSWYVTEPRWSKNGKKVAFARYDINDYINGNRMSSEIWVLKNAQDYIGNPVTDSTNSDLVKIDGDIAADGPAVMKPNWNRSNDVVSYAYDSAKQFNINVLRDSGPAVAYRDGQFDQRMQYVPAATDPPDTFAENSYHEWGLSWNIADGSEPWAVNSEREIEDGSTKVRVRAYEISDSTTVKQNGGIVFHNGRFIAHVASGDTKAEGTSIQVEEPGSTPSTQNDTLIKTGVAREFHHSGEGFSKDVTVKFHYTQEDLDKLGLDGSDEEQLMNIYWYNPDSNSWEKRGGVVDPSSNTLTFLTDHFSTFEMGFETVLDTEASQLKTVDSKAVANGSDSAHLQFEAVSQKTGSLGGLRVRLESDRGDTDSIQYKTAQTEGDGTIDVFVQSDTAGTSVLNVKNLGPHFTQDTVTVQFLEGERARTTRNGTVYEKNRTSIMIPNGAFDRLPNQVIMRSKKNISPKKQTTIDDANFKVEADEGEMNLLDQLPEGERGPVREFKLMRSGSEIGTADTPPKEKLELTIPYPDSVKDVFAQDLKIAVLDEDEGQWTMMGGKANFEEKNVTVKVPHLSIFKVVVRGAVSEMDDVRAYPNPWTPNVPTASDAPSNKTFGIKFNVPLNRNLKLTIFDELGQKVTEKTVFSSDATLRWNLRNQHGRKVASGVYIWVLQDQDTGETVKGKVAVVK